MFQWAKQINPKRNKYDKRYIEMLVDYWEGKPYYRVGSCKCEKCIRCQNKRKTAFWRTRRQTPINTSNDISEFPNFMTEMLSYEKFRLFNRKTG